MRFLSFCARKQVCGAPTVTHQFTDRPCHVPGGWLGAGGGATGHEATYVTHHPEAIPQTPMDDSCTQDFATLPPLLLQPLTPF